MLVGEFQNILSPPIFLFFSQRISVTHFASPGCIWCLWTPPPACMKKTKAGRSPVFWIAEPREEGQSDVERSRSELTDAGADDAPVRHATADTPQWQQATISHDIRHAPCSQLYNFVSLSLSVCVCVCLFLSTRCTCRRTQRIEPVWRTCLQGDPKKAICTRGSKAQSERGGGFTRRFCPDALRNMSSASCPKRLYDESDCLRSVGRLFQTRSPAGLQPHHRNS